MIKTIRDFADDRVNVRNWLHSTAARVREEYRAAGYHPVQVGLLGREGFGLRPNETLCCLP